MPEQNAGQAMTFWQALLQEIGTPESWAARAAGAVVVALAAALLYGLALVVERRLRPVLQRRAEAAPGAKAAHVRAATTALSLVGSVVRWGILLVGALYLLAAFGVNLWPALTGVGFLGAAIAFGAQSLVRDLVTGLFILLEGQYAVGEYVTLNGIFGQVAQITLRTTALDLPDGKRQYFPNGAISSVAVYPEPLVWYELLVPLASAEQAEELAEPLRTLAESLQASFPRRLVHVTSPEPYAGQEAAPGLRLRLAVRPGSEWVATEEAVGRVKALLETRKIAVPGGLQPVSRVAEMPEAA